MRRHWWMKGLAFLVLAPAFLAVMSLIVMLLWNALVPGLFAGPVLGFWQAVGLLVLCRILFGGLRHGAHRGWGHHGWRHRQAWRERWERMTPEERERFREGMRQWKQRHRGFGRCGSWTADEAAPVDATHTATSTSSGEEGTAPRTGATL